MLDEAAIVSNCIVIPCLALGLLANHEKRRLGNIFMSYVVQLNALGSGDEGKGHGYAVDKFHLREYY